MRFCRIRRSMRSSLRPTQPARSAGDTNGGRRQIRLDGKAVHTLGQERRGGTRRGGPRRRGARRRLSQAVPSGDDRAQGAHTKRPARNPHPLRERADGTRRSLYVSRLLRSNPQEAPAGAMTATGVHNLDAMIYLFGRIDEVYCTNLRHVMARLEDTTSIMLTFSTGMSATLFCSLVTAVTYRFAVYGTKGCVELANQDVEFRFTPAPETPPTGRHTTPAPEIVD